MTGPSRKTSRSLRLAVYSALIASALTWVVVQIYHVRNGPNNQVITFLFEDFGCSAFTIFTDPTLDEFDQSFAIRINPDGPQAVRLPPNWGQASFWDLDGNGAFKTELRVGSFGVGEDRVTYSILALGAQLPCGREELRDRWLLRTSDVFETAIVVQPRLSPTHGLESD